MSLFIHQIEMEILKDKIPKHIFRRLQKAEIDSLHYFLLKSKMEIADKLQLSIKEVITLQNIVSGFIVNANFVNAFDLKNDKNLWTAIYVGCPIVDKIMNGIPTRGITEIYGESGSGKTQICLHLALQVQKREELGGLNAGAIFICTEDCFPSKRLHEISEFLPRSMKENQQKGFTDDVFIDHIQDLEELKNCITVRLPVLLSRTKVKLIIVDSITAVFRYDPDILDYITRAEDLRFLANNLNKLSLQYNLAVICINQITTDPDIGDKPCLGLSWSNLVRKRIQLKRTNQSFSYNNQMLPIRTMRIVFCPETPNKDCNFIIRKNGIYGIQ